MCTGISNEMTFNVTFKSSNYSSPEDFEINHNTPCQSVLFKSSDIKRPTLVNISAPFDDQLKFVDLMKYFEHFDDLYYNQNINNNSLYLIFESFEFINFDNLFDLNFDQRGSYDEKHEKLGYIRLKSTPLILYPGQAYFISLKPIISDGNGFQLELNPQLEQLPIKLESNEITFGIMLQSRQIKVEKFMRNNCKLF